MSELELKALSVSKIQIPSSSLLMHISHRNAISIQPTPYEHIPEYFVLLLNTNDLPRIMRFSEAKPS
jgi:hypothetical protein